MVVGENARTQDLDVNAVREKKQTNVRAAGPDDTVAARPAQQLSSTVRWSSSAPTSASRSTPTP